MIFEIEARPRGDKKDSQHINLILKLNSYLTEYILRLHYKDHQVNPV
jgi:hypothetical protein